MKENINTIKSTVLGFIFGQMGENMRGNGPMVNSTEKVLKIIKEIKFYFKIIKIYFF